MVYASTSLSLAAVETFVNLEPNLRPADLVSIEGAITGAPGKTKFSDSDSMTAPMAVETRWRVRFGFWPGSGLMDMGYYPCAIAMPPLMSPVEVAPARQNTNRHALV